MSVIYRSDFKSTKKTEALKVCGALATGTVLATLTALNAASCFPRWTHDHTSTIRELFASKHGRFQHYYTQFALCSVIKAASCWYCSRYGSRRLPEELRGQFLPLGTEPNAAGDDWKRLPERWADVGSGAACAQAYETDMALPSNVLDLAYRTEQTAAPPSATVARLAGQTLLEESDIRSIFARLHAKAQQRVVVARNDDSSDDGDASEAPAVKRPKHKTSQAVRQIKPLEKGALVGRHVLIPLSKFPDDACDEESGEGWRAQIMSESHGVVGVKENRFPTNHWPLDAVLSWTPIT